ncbi:hypothetical protein CUC15_15875 [Oceanobacillus zhaokaii]|uniref:Uncharacterized protein n=1 Tax=Oceanobacillus zhaokaii TaxID=2052660 RepID=A0A345PJY9_9BACI|nr:hypothetical protein [Oceanobacillus zhaokaii]AXI10319.1 hypothetical protein CUC15_15875 [Oceanobacillus zhaokaii]
MSNGRELRRTANLSLFYQVIALFVDYFYYQAVSLYAINHSNFNITDLEDEIKGGESDACNNKC